MAKLAMAKGKIAVVLNVHEMRKSPWWILDREGNVMQSFESRGPARRQTQTMKRVEPDRGFWIARVSIMLDADAPGLKKRVTREEREDDPHGSRFHSKVVE